MANNHKRLENLLRQVLSLEFDKIGLRNEICIAGDGANAIVFWAESSEFGKIAFKVPWNRYSPDDLDKGLDSRLLLRQEYLILKHLETSSVPVPKPFFVHEGQDDFDFLAMEYIDYDSSEPSAFEHGQAMRAIHNSVVPNVQFTNMGTKSFIEMFKGRLPKNLGMIREKNFAKLPTSLIQKVCSRFDDLIKDDSGCNSLLHLDCRLSNVLAKKGRLRAIVDWSNAIVGHPGMDIARLSENGLLSEEFKKGYRWLDVHTRYSGELQKIFELEANAFVSIVYLTILGKPDEGRHFIES